MKTIIRICVVVCLALLPLQAAALEPVRAGQENSISRAVWAEDRLWVLSDAGQLFTLGEHDVTPRLEYAGDPVADICLLGGRIEALTQSSDDEESWSLRRRQDGKWVTDISFPSDAGDFSLTCNSNSVVLLGGRRLLTFADGKISGVALSRDTGFGVVSTYATPDHLYVGFNRGEWGGGLIRIDRASGRVTQIENVEGDLCGGLLNTECDPVNGLAPLPWQPECLAAAVGLVHFDAHGQVVSVCGDKLELVYKKQFGKRFENESLPPKEAYPTMAFFGLLAEGKDLLAVGLDGLFRIHGNGKSDLTPMPDFRQVGPFYVSFADPNVVLVLTSVNQRHSGNGATPLLVPRR